MNGLELLKEDHRKVLDIIYEIEQTSERAIKTREKLLTKLTQLIKIHEKMEEKVIYPAAKKSNEMEDLVNEAYEEHHVVDNILAELSELSANAENWKAKVTVMRENLEHHIEEEEQNLFPKLEKKFDQQALEQFGDKMQKIQDETS